MVADHFVSPFIKDPDPLVYSTPIDLQSFHFSASEKTPLSNLGSRDLIFFR